MFKKKKIIQEMEPLLTISIAMKEGLELGYAMCNNNLDSEYWEKKKELEDRIAKLWEQVYGNKYLA